MKITISKSVLVDALGTVHRAANQRSTMPILANVHLEAVDGELRVQCSDPPTSIVRSVEATVEEAGATTTPAKRLFDVIKAMPGNEVSLRTDGGHLLVRSDRAQFKLATLPAEDWPAAEPMPEERVALDAAQVTTMLSRVAFAASTDEGRPHLYSVLVRIADGLATMVATDGHRLALDEQDAEGELDLLLPRDAVEHLRRLIDGGQGTVFFAELDARCWFRFDGITLTTRRPDTKFPPYEKIIPTEKPARAYVSREGLIAAIRRATLVGQRAGLVSLTVGAGAIRVAAETPDIGTSSEDVAAEFDGASMLLGFNASYLVDALESMETDDVVLEIRGITSAMIVRPRDPESGQLGVVMPMRI